MKIDNLIKGTDMIINLSRLVKTKTIVFNELNKYILIPNLNIINLMICAAKTIVSNLM